MAHGVVRTDNLAGIYDGSKIVSIKFNNGTADAEIDNGSIVSLDAYLGQDVYKAVKPAAEQKLGKLVLVAGIELFKDGKKPLDQWVNEAGVPCRGYVLQQGDVFSVTADVIHGTPDMTTNKYADIEAATTLKAGAAAGGGKTNFAELIAIENAGAYTYYVYRVL